MTRFFKPLILTALLLFSFIPVSKAQSAEGPYVQVRLLPERGTIQPGETLTIAIEQSIAPGWHTYWKNPGDSGAAPRVKWYLPDGFTSSEIEWPVPHKLPYGPLLNYGYENSVILLQKITSPAHLPPGPIVLKADIDILVCKEICIPESGTYEITLNGPDAASENNSNFFANASSWIPKPMSWTVFYEEKNGYFKFTIPINHQSDLNAPDFAKFSITENMEFFPEDWGIVENAALQSIQRDKAGIILSQKRGERSLDDFGQINFVLAGFEDGHRYGIVLSAKPLTQNSALPKTDMAETGFLNALILALLGGLVLNLMPCVFPVLSIKALSLVKISEKNPALARLHGLAYTAGITLSFLAIAALLIALKSAGTQIGWGFQLQNPVMVTCLAYLLFVIGLNLSGLFDIGNHFGNTGNRLTAGNTPGHSFFTGVLATLVATPCTAPFMGLALGYALVQPAYVALVIFAALGFGLAFPYLLLSFVPALQRILPRPGAWMETFKQLLAFPMYASSAWLVWVVGQQEGSMAVLAALMGIVLLAFGIWLLRHMPVKKSWRVTVRVLAILSFLAALVMIPGGMKHMGQNAAANFGDPYTPEKLSQLLETNDPVFVEMTAAWCITCKLNHAVAINTNSTRRVFADNNVKYLVGDWTNQNPDITQYLNSFGRNGVPIYVYYGPRQSTGQRPEPVLLPQILTPGIVSDIVNTK